MHGIWENESDTLGNDYSDWMVDGYGRQFQNNNLYIEEQDPFGDSPSNQYRYYGNTGPGLFIYNGVDGDNTNYCAYLKLGCYQNDDDDRNIIYYTHTDTTSTVDYDAHQTFGVTGTGRVQESTYFSQEELSPMKDHPIVFMLAALIMVSLLITVVGIAHICVLEILIIVMFVIILILVVDQYLKLFLVVVDILMEVPMLDPLICVNT